MLLARLKDTPSDKSGAWRTFGKGVGKPGLTRAASSVLHVHDEDFIKSSRQQPVAQVFRRPWTECSTFEKGVGMLQLASAVPRSLHKQPIAQR